MALILRTINPEIIEDWMIAIARFSKLLKGAIGDSIVGVYASESPEFGIGDYNVVVVLSTPITDDIVERVIEIAGEACKRLNVTIVPKVVSTKDIEGKTYVEAMEGAGIKIL